MVENVEQNRTSEKLMTKTRLLLTLSQFFAKGGEQLQETLGPFTRDAGAYVETEKLSELIPAVKALEKYTQSSTSEYEEMKYEFNRLFVGPAAPKAPPYESVYRSPDHLVMQEQTLDVRKMYNQEQLLSTGQGCEPDDFIGTELEFMAYLLSRAIHANQEQNTSKTEHYLDFYRDFCSDHMDLWVESFAQSICRSTDHPVYLAVSQLILAATQTSESIA